MTTKNACTKFEQAIDKAMDYCKSIDGKVALEQMKNKVAHIREDNSMLDWYYGRLDGFIDALFFADIINDAHYEALNDCMIILSRSTPA